MKPRLLLSVKQSGPVYTAAFTACGAEVTEAYMPEISTDYDGLVLCGGDDLHPKYYGQENTACGIIDDDRDTVEMALLDAFVKAGKPVMGICRGHQLVNVYFGGTLHQHMPDTPKHRQSKEHYCVHEVEATGLLEELYGKAFFVNSYHHQAIDRLGDGLCPLASCGNVIEAVMHKTLPVLSVQWHPEKLSFKYRRDDAVDGEALLRYFVDMCK